MKPWRSSERCRIATSRLRLQKMIAFLKSAASRMSLRSTARLSAASRPDGTRYCVTVVAAVAGLRLLDPHRVGQERVGEALDLGRHGRREEQRLAGEGEDLADALDVRDEAHVEHAVGLVDDEDLDAGQQDLAAAEMVEQAARRRDQHVGAAVELLLLVVDRRRRR